MSIFRRFFIVATLLGLGSPAFAGVCHLGPFGTQHIYLGDFSLVNSTGKQCDAIFDQLRYEANFHQVGSTGTNFALNFRGAESKGFLHNATFVGLLGADCDFGGSKTVTVSGVRYELHLEGIVDRTFIYATLKVTASEEHAIVCKAQAEYSGNP